MSQGQSTLDYINSNLAAATRDLCYRLEEFDDGYTTTELNNWLKLLNNSYRASKNPELVQLIKLLTRHLSRRKVLER